MGKQGLSLDAAAASSGLKEYPMRWSEMLLINGRDPSRGRRVSGADDNWDKASVFLKGGCKNGGSRVVYYGGSKRHLSWLPRHIRTIIFTFLLLGLFFGLDSFMFSYFDPTFLKTAPTPSTAAYDASKVQYFEFFFSWLFNPLLHVFFLVLKDINGAEEEESPVMYPRLMNMASASLAEVVWFKGVVY